MFVQLNLYQGYPGMRFLVACAWDPNSFKELVLLELLILKQPVQVLQVVQFLMTMLASRRSSRLWGRLSSGSRNPQRFLLRGPVSQRLAGILAL